MGCPDSSPTPSTLSAVVCKWSPKRKPPNASTREPPTASAKSAKKRASPLSSRVPAPTFFVVLVPPWSLSSTAKPRTCSTSKQRKREFKKLKTCFLFFNKYGRGFDVE